MVWPPEDNTDGRRGERAAQTGDAGAEPAGSPWWQPPGTVAPLAWPPVRDNAAGGAEGGLQHGRPIPHTPAGGEPVSAPGGGIPISGGNGIPVSGGIPVGAPF